MKPRPQDVKMPSKEYFAPGIQTKGRTGDLRKLDIGQILDYVIQRHHAHRAGLHKDLRAGPTGEKMFSWAARKPLPQEGKSIGMFRTNLHDYDYKDFEGIIPSGRYGAGTVEKEQEGKLLITKKEKGGRNLHFTTADSQVPKRYAVVHPPERDWKRALLIRAKTPENPGVDKPKLKNIDPDQILEYLKNLGPEDEAQPKVDGASTLMHITKNRDVEALSHRTSKRTGRPVFHTERFFGSRPKAKVDREYLNSVLLGEMYGKKNNQVIPAQELGGLLNSSIGKSLKTQKDAGVELRTMLFDILRKGRKDMSQVPYGERVEELKRLLPQLPQSDKFELPERAFGPEEIMKLYRQIESGKHPLTNEGMVIRPAHGEPSKAKLTQEHDVHIRSIFEGQGKYQGKGAGGFEYSLKPGGKSVGRVGTGLSDETRELLRKNPEAFINRVARIRAQGQFPETGAYRNPALLALHEG